MGCTDCESGSSCGSSGGGCGGKGSCGTGRHGDSDVYDWLANMQLPNGKSQFDIVEIRFKHNRKAFYRNLNDLKLVAGDTVVVEASPGLDVGVISVAGELARIQLKRKEPNFKVHEAKKVVRHATQQDIDKWVQAYKQEEKTKARAREIARDLNLEMKISDVEYQGDNSKATFYYTANGRVDFRQLIKDFATEFRVRIEMRQIGARQEAAMLGGISSSGRVLCSSTWLKDLRTVSTTAARYQQLSLNPQKLAGLCGKLKCCLNFELDSYIEALKEFPSTKIKLRTKNGVGIHIKTDVFKQMMWYLQQSQTEGVEPALIALSPDRVKEIIALNKKNEFPEDLRDFEIELFDSDDDNESVKLHNVVGQDDLTRFDKNFTKKKKRRKKKRRPDNKGPENKHSSNDQNPRGQAGKGAPRGKGNTRGKSNRRGGDKKNQ